MSKTDEQRIIRSFEKSIISQIYNEYKAKNKIIEIFLDTTDFPTVIKEKKNVLEKFYKMKLFKHIKFYNKTYLYSRTKEEPGELEIEMGQTDFEEHPNSELEETEQECYFGDIKAKDINVNKLYELYRYYHPPTSPTRPEGTDTQTPVFTLEEDIKNFKDSKLRIGNYELSFSGKRAAIINFFYKGRVLKKYLGFHDYNKYAGRENGNSYKTPSSKQFSDDIEAINKRVYKETDGLLTTLIKLKDKKSSNENNKFIMEL